MRDVISRTVISCPILLYWCVKVKPVQKDAKNKQEHRRETKAHTQSPLSRDGWNDNKSKMCFYISSSIL